jgi:hypothetical protein
MVLLVLKAIFKLGMNRPKIVHTLLKGGKFSGNRNIENDKRVNHNVGLSIISFNPESS